MRARMLNEISTAQPEHLAVEGQVGASIEGGIQRQILRHDADQALDLVGLFDDVVAVDAGAALGGREQADKHGNGRAFPCTVRPQEANAKEGAPASANSQLSQKVRNNIQRGHTST